MFRNIDTFVIVTDSFEFIKKRKIIVFGVKSSTDIVHIVTSTLVVLLEISLNELGLCLYLVIVCRPFQVYL